MEEKRIVSALIGLIGACNNNPKTENTDRIVIKALAFPLVRPEADAENFQAVIEEIHKEKFTIAPGCSACQTPCGNTSDYDMDRIYGAEAGIRDLKLRILSALRELAADVYSSQELDVLSERSMEFFYKALIYVSLDMERASLFTFWDEVQDTIAEIRRQIRECKGILT